MKLISGHAIRAALGLTFVFAALVAAGCGSDDDSNTSAAAAGEFAAVKSYLLDHSADLQQSTAKLKQQADEYYSLAEASGFDYQKMLDENRAQVSELVTGMQGTFRTANPQYEEAEGVVAGVPELADYDVILDAGSSAEDDPESAVPFNLKLPNGKVEKQPGNFFFLTETALWGTEPKFAAQDVKPDLNDDGKVAFGEALPEANHLKAAATDFNKYATELDDAAKQWTPSDEDVFTALVVMTPTMAEYFDAWKNSRFIAGDKADEASFVATSRLSDITDILSGLVLAYDNVEPKIAASDPAQAKQIGESLTGLRDYAADLRDREADGEKFTAEQADTLGAEAQTRAEEIAGQVTQAAAKLGVNIEN